MSGRDFWDWEDRVCREGVVMVGVSDCAPLLHSSKMLKIYTETASVYSLMKVRLSAGEFGYEKRT